LAGGLGLSLGVSLGVSLESSFGVLNFYLVVRSGSNGCHELLPNRRIHIEAHHSRRHAKPFLGDSLSRGKQVGYVIFGIEIDIALTHNIDRPNG
jgi:hypothetical protein